jgi:hypothetical protein
MVLWLTFQLPRNKNAPTEAGASVVMQSVNNCRVALYGREKSTVFVPAKSMIVNTTKKATTIALAYAVSASRRRSSA